MPVRLAPLVLVFCLIAAPAHAYIDPGAGSLILQLIIGGIGGAFVAFKMFWGRFRGRSKQQPPE